MRRLITIPAVLGLLLAVAGPVDAATPQSAPEHTTVSFPLDSHVEECVGFDIVAPGGTVTRNMLTWYDESGEVLLERWTVRFDIPVYNSVTGLEGVYTGRFVRTFDAVAGTLQLVGAFRQLHVAGRNALSASGHIVWDDNTGELLFGRGHGDIDEFFGGWCEAMAG